MSDRMLEDIIDRMSEDMSDRMSEDMPDRISLCLIMFKQTCWELWSGFHMAHWHSYILFDRLTCIVTCQVKHMIGIVSYAKIAWQKFQTKVESTSCMVGIIRSKINMFFVLVFVIFLFDPIIIHIILI